MNTQNFHIQKEEQVKQINKVIQLAKHNHLEESLKNLVIVNGEKAIKAINNERKEVYKQLDKFDFHPATYNPESQKNIVDIPVNIEDTRFIETQIANIVSRLMDECTKLYMTAIVNSSTNEKFSPSDDFQNASYEVFQCLKTIHSSLGEANPPEEGVSASIENFKKETHVLTEEDLKENPELIETGLRTGDTIDLNAPAGEKLSESIESHFDGPEEKVEYNHESDKKLSETEEETTPPAVYTPEQPPVVKDRKKNKKK